jgi:hypothetical protein
LNKEIIATNKRAESQICFRLARRSPTDKFTKTVTEQKSLPKKFQRNVPEREKSVQIKFNVDFRFNAF